MEAIKAAMQLAKRVLPPWKEIQAEAKERAGKIEIGRTLFFEKYGVASEAEYKRRAKQQGIIMTHAHIGLDTWEETKQALLFLYDGMSKRGLVLDRFGLCLDRVMAYPPEMRASVPRETGPQLKSLEEWMEVGQVVPIQPHAGDFMIGFPASVTNTECALRAGITTIGNVSQFFAHGTPAWEDEVATAVETAKALAMMGRLRPQGVLVHSYLDDGFGALFNDYADVAGWAYLENYIVEDLIGAQLAHCFGGVTSDPLTRAAWVMIMREIHGVDGIGSMWYGDTISFSEDFDRNLGLDAEYLLWDIAAQLRYPTGHAVLPLPVTEAVRIPNAKDILQAQVLARRVEESARRMLPYLDWKPAEAIKNRLIAAGRQVVQRALSGLEREGVDIGNPLEMLFVLKKIGPINFEREYGAGVPDTTGLRGRKPVQITDIFARSEATSNRLIQCIPCHAPIRQAKVLLAATDVHEHALFIIQKALTAMGLTPVLAGAELNPCRIVQAAHGACADAIVVSTYNGTALEMGKSLRCEADRLHMRIPIYIGGRLNQGVEGRALPIDVAADLAALGLIPCESIPEALEKIQELVKKP